MAVMSQDKAINDHCGKLIGDVVIADKGYYIQDLLAPKRVILPFLKEKDQHEETETRRIAYFSKLHQSSQTRSQIYELCSQHGNIAITYHRGLPTSASN